MNEQGKVKGQTASIVEFILGAVILLGSLGTIGDAFGHYSPSFLWFNLFWLFLGGGLLASAIEWRLLIKAYRTYATLLAADSDRSVSRLASATNASPKIVRENLKLMIKKKMTAGVALDEQGDRVVMSQTSHSASVQQKKSATAAAPQMPGSGDNVPSAPAPAEANGGQARETVEVSCPGCGARTEIARGAQGTCEYCGASLNA